MKDKIKHGLLAFLCIVLLVVILGCAEKKNIDGVECIIVVDIFATSVTCNWDAYNAQPVSKVCD